LSTGSNEHSPYFINLIHPFVIVLQLKIVEIVVTIITFPILDGFIYEFNKHIWNVKKTSNLKNLMEIRGIE